MAVKLKNNARGFLAVAITDTDMQVTLAAGTGAAFPVLSAGESFFTTIVATDNTFEIVDVTARAGDVLTVVRGAEETIRSVGPGSLSSCA